VAVSDPTRTIAQPLPTLVRRRGRRPPFARIVELIERWDVADIVIGLPLLPSGDEGPMAAEVREFADALARRSGLPVAFWDERLTSVQSERELARLDLPVTARREKERVDAMAAVLILQAYLNAHGQS
jgi:putative Holliday junction resolvase